MLYRYEWIDRQISINSLNGSIESFSSERQIINNLFNTLFYFTLCIYNNAETRVSLLLHATIQSIPLNGKEIEELDLSLKTLSLYLA